MNYYIVFGYGMSVEGCGNGEYSNERFGNDGNSYVDFVDEDFIVDVEFVDREDNDG